MEYVQPSRLRPTFALSSDSEETVGRTAYSLRQAAEETARGSIAGRSNEAALMCDQRQASSCSDVGQNTSTGLASAGRQLAATIPQENNPRSLPTPNRSPSGLPPAEPANGLNNAEAERRFRRAKPEAEIGQTERVLVVLAGVAPSCRPAEASSTEASSE